MTEKYLFRLEAEDETGVGEFVHSWNTDPVCSEIGEMRRVAKNRSGAPDLYEALITIATNVSSAILIQKLLVKLNKEDGSKGKEQKKEEDGDYEVRVESDPITGLPLIIATKRR